MAFPANDVSGKFMWQNFQTELFNLKSEKKKITLMTNVEPVFYFALGFKDTLTVLIEFNYI